MRRTCLLAIGVCLLLGALCGRLVDAAGPEGICEQLPARATAFPWGERARSDAVKRPGFLGKHGEA